MPHTGPVVRPVVVDAMGGDAAPSVIIDGALQAHARGVPVILVGDAQRIGSRVPDSVPVVPAAGHVPMDAAPVHALRAQPDASIAVAMRLLAEGRACALVSCGNTGATVVAAVRTLGHTDGADRVALAVDLPVIGSQPPGRLMVLDVGANVEVRPAHLVGFARLGLHEARARGLDEPRLAILSNGEEPTKGTGTIREALRLAAQEGLGLAPMEPGPALAGNADVLVTDGFTGNILLKSLEAATAAVGRLVGDRASADLDTVSWRHRSGARLLGVPAPVFVGHGRADAVAAASIILGAWERGRVRR